MSHGAVRTLSLAVLCLAVLCLAAAPAGAQQPPLPCSADRLAGAWAYTMTGTFILPTGPVPAAAVGTFVSTPAGEVEGSQHFSLAGTAGQETVRGTFDDNGDCTGTMTLGLYHPSGTLLRTAVWAVVFDDNARESRAIFKSLTLANGTNIPTVGTATARKLFTNPVGR